MTSTIVLPNGFPYVAGAILSTAWVLAGQSIVVSKYRKAAGVKYPQLYAEKAEAEASKAAMQFNCAQRAHQNTLENIPVILITTLITALKFPLVAASACGLWSASRILYTRGYVTGIPSKRNSTGGSLGTLSLLSLALASTYTVYELILASL